MDKNKLISTIDKFKEKKIIVIGDIMLDKYIWGSVKRISQEAPVQIVDVSKENYAPGGAANVANNIAALGGIVYIVGIVGEDEAKKILISELQKRSIITDSLISDSKKPTTQKIRIMGHSQQLLRIDYEEKEYLNKEYEKKIIEYIDGIIKEIDAIVVSDYAKGVVTESMMNQLISICRENNKTIIIDPKPKHKLYYKNATLIAPNHKEASEMAKIEETNEEDLIKIGSALVKELNSNILLTRGEKGMSLFNLKNNTISIPTKAKEVYDVTGAGDTVVAALSLALSSKADLEEAAVIANHAAGIVVGKVGTSTLNVGELKDSIEYE